MTAGPHTKQFIRGFGRRNMKRRSVLAAAGTTLVAFGGCLGGPGADDDPAENTPESVDLSLETVQRGVVEYTYPDAISVVEGDRRFVAVAAGVTDSDDPPARDDFALRFDGSEHEPLAVDQPSEYYRLGPFYADANPGGQLLFGLPLTGDASDAAVVTPEGTWPLPADVRRRMAAAPSFSVTVESVGSAGAPRFAVEAANEGERPQRFLAAVNKTGPMYAPVEAPTAVVDAGATATLEVPVPITSAVRLTERPEGETRTGSVSFDWVSGGTDRQFPLS